MTEASAIYSVRSVGNLTDKRFLKSRSLHCFSDPRYEPPTPEDVVFLVAYTGWTQREVADRLGVASTAGFGSSTCRKWMTPKNSTNHRQIPYSAWRLALLEAGIVDT